MKKCYLVDLHTPKKDLFGFVLYSYLHGDKTPYCIVREDGKNTILKNFKNKLAIIMKIIKGDFGLLFFIHLILILVVYLSPFLIPWQFLLLILGYLVLQELLIGGCLLSFAQFGYYNRQEKFFPHYFKILGFKTNDKIIDIIFVWLVPSLVLLLAVILQELINYQPVISFYLF